MSIILFTELCICSILLDIVTSFAEMLKIEAYCCQIFLDMSYNCSLFAIEGKTVILASYRNEVTLELQAMANKQ